MPRFSAVILAAGASSRLGEHKPLARIGGQSLLERAARLFAAAGAADILAVAGCRAAETRAEAARLAASDLVLRCVDNPRHAEGMFTSVQAGLAALPPDVEAFFVLPVDIPLVRPHTLRLLLDRFASGEGAPAVLHPIFLGRRGHPPLIAARWAADLAAHSGADGLSGALAALEVRRGAADVFVADAGIHCDADTPEALAAARARAQRLDIPLPAEAEALLALFGAGERGLAHGRGVARAALALARALNARGAALDLELVESAALAHDIAKGAAGHEAAGAAVLDGLGYGRAARIVAAHRDIRPEDAPEITERELVYLADKLVRGPARVSVESRFQEKLEAFADDAAVCAAIRRRLANALDMRARVEAAAGAGIEAILAMEERK
jgi:CTP:molybdopterin cytidylyltransferase MocA